MAKKKILMVCEAFGGGVFTYVSQLCNDMVDDFDVYLAYSLRPQTPKNYKDFLNQRVHLIKMKNVGVKGLTNLKSDIAAIKELRQIEKDVQPDVIHLHSSVAGGLGRLAYKGKNNTVVYTPHGYAHILMGPGKKSKVYKFAEKVLGNRALTLTCCESEDEEAKKFSKRTAYVETGVNLADLSTSLDGIKPVKNDRFTVFTLGRACVQKQPQLFNKIAELVPDARFVWIGNGELENELKAPNIEVTGWKPRKEALAMAKGADAFILCSLGEAIAMSLIENMYIFILHALTGSAKEAVRGTCKNPDLKCVTINLYAKSGIIKEISGWEKIRQMKDCRFALQYAHIGQKCVDNQAILSKLGMAYFCNDSISQLEKDVAEMYTYFVAEDENGNDMVYDRVDPSYISRWWKGDILNGL